nr:MAG TPA: hypothetical protein [Caudoviricetes sp.]
MGRKCLCTARKGRFPGLFQGSGVVGGLQDFERLRGAVSGLELWLGVG